MIQVALYEPEIPPNTGNIIRLCANTGVSLHLIHPLGFVPDDARLKRAGLDYHEWTRVSHHENYDAFMISTKPKELYACSTKGKLHYTDVAYSNQTTLLFGPETRGLPQSVLENISPYSIIRIPMLKSSRSLNLSNAVAIIVYEALRQVGFDVLSLN